jgi:hypothetical protein
VYATSSLTSETAVITAGIWDLNSGTPETAQAIARTGEGAFLVTEELGSNQRLRDCGAIHTDKCPICTVRSLVDDAGINSFPVPVSPRIRIVESEGATLQTCRSTLCSASEEPTISSNIESRSICSRNARFSLRVLSSAWTRSLMSVPLAYQANHPSLVVTQRVVMDEKPSVVSILAQDSFFVLEWHVPRKRFQAFASESRAILQIKGSIANILRHDLFDREARVIEHGLIHIKTVSSGFRTAIIWSMASTMVELLISRSVHALVRAVCDRSRSMAIPAMRLA